SKDLSTSFSRSSPMLIQKLSLAMNHLSRNYSSHCTAVKISATVRPTMSSDGTALTAKPQLKAPRGSRMVITRFVARHSLRSAAFIALAFAAFVAAKVVGYADLYPSTQDRLAAAALFNNNVGLEALFGAPYHLDTVTGYAA